MGSPYRDSNEALWSRLRAADEAVAAEEARYTELFWDEVAPAIGLAPPQAWATPAPRPEVEALRDAVEARETRLAALLVVDRDFHEILAAWSRPHAEVPPCPARVGYGVRGAIARTFVEDRAQPAFEQAVRTLETDTPPAVHSEGKSATVASFTAGGVPFEARCETYMTQQSGDWLADVTVQTTVPALFGALQLTPQGFGAELLIALSLTREVTLGDPAFDGTFVVKGEEATARLLLPSEVRSRLLVIARDDIPRLVVHRGLASLLWRFDPSPATLTAAVEALAAIRGAPACRPLRHEQEGA